MKDLESKYPVVGEDLMSLRFVSADELARLYPDWHEEIGVRHPNSPYEDYRAQMHGLHWSEAEQELMKDPTNQELQNRVRAERDALIDGWRKERD
jgi:hypothetical protein